MANVSYFIFYFKIFNVFIFFVVLENILTRKLRFIDKFKTSSTGKQTTAIHISAEDEQNRILTHPPFFSYFDSRMFFSRIVPPQVASSSLNND